MLKEEPVQGLSARVLCIFPEKELAAADGETNCSRNTFAGREGSRTAGSAPIREPERSLARCLS